MSDRHIDINTLPSIAMASRATRESRKYVDLISCVTSKFANWDPASRIKVGDYGRFDRETGIYEVCGNIYKEPEFKDKLPHLGPPVEGESGDQMVVKSFGGTKSNFSEEPTPAGLVDVGIGGEYTFARRRGGLLVMAGFRHNSLPVEMLDDFMGGHHLQGYSLVTSTISCRGYALSTTKAGGDMVSVSLQANIPLPPAPGLIAKGEMAASWEWKAANGMCRDGWNVEGKQAFVPLFTLKNPTRRTIFQGFRLDYTPPPPTGFELLERTDFPWGDLDEDGESEESDEEI